VRVQKEREVRGSEAGQRRNRRIFYRTFWTTFIYNYGHVL